MENYNLITIMGNTDIDVFKLIDKTIEKDNYRDWLNKKIKEQNKKNENFKIKGYGPLLNILFQDYHRNKDYNINKLVFIFENDRRDENKYVLATEGLKIICEILNIKFQKEIFEKDRSIIDYDDLYEILNYTINKEREGEKKKKKILINITSGIGQWKTTSIMFLNRTKNIFMIDVLHQEEKIIIDDEEKFKKLTDHLKSRILEFSFKNDEKLDSNMVFSGIEDEKKKIDLFIDIAKSYLENNNEKTFLFPLLILGDTGTGKTALVEYIKSKLIPEKEKKVIKSENFVSFNSAGITQTLIDSELFGYKKGSFDMAKEDRNGLISKADNGVLFMDELGELSLDSQSKLLLTLQDGTYRKVGDVKNKKSYFVFIGATNRDLLSEIKAGNFREDFYWRVNSIVINLKPISERTNRKEIIKELFKKEIEVHNNFFRNMGIKIENKIDQNIIDAISDLDLKGNFRELKKLLKDAILKNILENNSQVVKLKQEDFNLEVIPTDITQLIDNISTQLLSYYSEFPKDYKDNKILNAIKYQIAIKRKKQLDLKTQKEIAKHLGTKDPKNIFDNFKKNYEELIDKSKQKTKL